MCNKGMVIPQRFVVPFHFLCHVLALIDPNPWFPLELGDAGTMFLLKERLWKPKKENEMISFIVKVLK